MQTLASARPRYADVLARLNRASVIKHFDAYLDVPWDEHPTQLDPHDARWELAEDDPLGASVWYRRQPAAERARIGLAFIAYAMKRGIEFESVLSHGLLEFAQARGRSAADFRYAYHELIEEGQHSLMFHEFVQRTRCEVPRMPAFARFFARRVPALAHSFPELFFVYVLAGEVPIDQAQRSMLERGKTLHPLARKIMQIHVTEEARHVCFAREYLTAHVPQLSWIRRQQLQWLAPFVCAETAQLMLAPPCAYTRRLGIPRWVTADVYASRRYELHLAKAVKPLYELLHGLQLVTPSTETVWQLLGLKPGALPILGVGETPQPQELQKALTQDSQNALDCAR